MGKSRKQHSKEFKAKVALEAVREGVGDNHVVERTLLGATTGKTDNNHEHTFVSWEKDPRLYRFIKEKQAT